MEYLAPRLIANRGYSNFYTELVSIFRDCETFSLSVAFIRFSGLQLLLKELSVLESRGIRGRILTSTYLNSTEPKALAALMAFTNIETRVFVPTEDRGFHSKGYIFESLTGSRIIIGSSNLTQSALKSNVEWNVLNEGVGETAFRNQVRQEFEAQWSDSRSQTLSAGFLEQYTEYLKRNRRARVPENAFGYENETVEPNKMQQEAISRLNRLRGVGEKRALAIAATGTGKTYLAVFDALQFKPRRLLFVVHREDILVKAKESFDRIFGGSGVTTGYFTGNRKDHSPFLFATVATLLNHYQDFGPDHFEYIVVDEAHHATSPSYQTILRYFSPRFLLGLTATPERTDGDDIYDLFDNNVAVEIRLRQALDWELVVPFHYFGISEISDIDLSTVDLDDIPFVAKKLMVSRRVDYVIEQMLFYGHDGQKRKGLGFCVSVEHAVYMASEFNRRGYPSAVLTGESPIDNRTNVVRQLESDHEKLQMIFVVDLFNEGVDIPTVNTVLMLRPTESSIVFVQQLGRGLRKAPQKEFVTVLDFIGNHKRTFMIAIALMGAKNFDKDDLKIGVSTEFADIPGSSHIQMDRVVRDQILKQIEAENFSAMKYLKELYFGFKRINSNRIPKLVDFLKVDGAVDPMRFVQNSGSFQVFVEKVEGQPLGLVDGATSFVLLKWVSMLLPAKRPYELAVLRVLLRSSVVTKVSLTAELGRWVAPVNTVTVDFAMRYWCGDFLDKGEKSKYSGLCLTRRGADLVPEETLQSLLLDAAVRDAVQDIVDYGLLRFELEFGDADRGVPFLKTGYGYAMRDIGLMANADRVQSSFRGQGLITYGNDYFIFVDLHKDDSVKESINYKDEFKSPAIFQWETPNTTSSASRIGKNLVNHGDLNISLHLFARKFSEVDGVTQAFVYYGRLHYRIHDLDRNKPMRILFDLETPLTDAQFYELTTKV